MALLPFVNINITSNNPIVKDYLQLI